MTARKPWYAMTGYLDGVSFVDGDALQVVVPSRTWTARDMTGPCVIVRSDKECVEHKRPMYECIAEAVPRGMAQLPDCRWFGDNP